MTNANPGPSTTTLPMNLLLHYLTNRSYRREAQAIVTTLFNPLYILHHP